MSLPSSARLDADPLGGALPAGASVTPGASERQARFEATDAPASTATPYTIAPGDSFSGQLNGDSDWVRVCLQAGKTYSIALSGAGSLPISDPFLTLRSGSGAVLATDDDSGPGYDSHLTFTATTSGAYYLQASSFRPETGGYTLGIFEAGNLPVDDIADFLTDGYWEGTGGERRAFQVPSGGVITVDVSALTPEGQRLAIDALGTWTATTGLRFRTQVGGADITFDDNDEGAYSTSAVSEGVILDSFVNVSTGWLAAYGTHWSGYAFQTYIHEIGHALGLGHAGPYNGSADWGWDNAFDHDSWQATVMSYFDQDTNPNIPGTYAALLTPMTADIMAIRTLYGEQGLLRTGDSSYGTSSNAGGIYALAATLLRAGTPGGVAFTIVDEGGNDILDLSLAATRVEIDLRQGTHSSAGGEVDNISIAVGTVIERASGGAGHDVIRGNASANALLGQAGNDHIQADAGNDTLVGGAGTDTLAGGAGNDVFHWGHGDVIVEGAGGGIDTALSGGSHQLAPGVENLILTGTAAVTGSGNGLANRMTGNAAANRLVGGLGNDTLDGLGGYDRLEGGGGDDTYVWAAGDGIVEGTGGGFDTVVSAQSHQLAPNVEALVLSGGAAVSGFGNDLANRLTGNAAANRLVGGLGNDTLAGLGGGDRLEGGAGDDTYIWTAGSLVVEAAGEGFDALETATNYLLGANLEGLVLTGSAAANGFGNDLGNVVIGNAATNRLGGGMGDDTLRGNEGADTFMFDAGSDWIRDMTDNVDTLAFSRALLGGPAATVAAVLAHGAVTAQGAVFTFEGGHRLVVAGIEAMSQLVDDIVLF